MTSPQELRGATCQIALCPGASGALQPTAQMLLHVTQRSFLLVNNVVRYARRAHSALQTVAYCEAVA